MYFMVNLESIINKSKMAFLGLGMIGLVSCSNKDNPVTIYEIEEPVVEEPVVDLPPSLNVSLDDRLFDGLTRINVDFNDDNGLKSAFFVIDDVRYDFDVEGEVSKQKSFIHNLEGEGLFDWYSVVEDFAGQKDSLNGEVYVVPVADQIVFEEDFEGFLAGDRFLKNSYLIIGEEEDNNFVRVKYTPNNRGSVQIFEVLDLEPSTEYFLKYSVYFEKDFEFSRGGKLPGLAPENPVWGCFKGVASQGWSTRFMWREEGKMTMYYYDQNREAGDCGSYVYAPEFNFEKERWYDLGLRVKLNSLGKSDGELELRVDNNSLIYKNDLNFRKTGGEISLINKLVFTTFFGGSDSSWSPSKTVYSRFDNIKVHTRK